MGNAAGTLEVVEGEGLGGTAEVSAEDMEGNGLQGKHRLQPWIYEVGERNSRRSEGKHK